MVTTVKITIEIDSFEDLHNLRRWLVSGVLPNHETRIEAAELTVRTMQSLQAAGIRRLEDLCSMTEYDTLKLPGISRAALKELKEALHERGLSFAI